MALDQTPALVVVIRDITHLVETQELLRISEEKFANAFHAYPDGLLISRLEDGTLIDVNEASPVSPATAATRSSPAPRSNSACGSTPRTASA